MRLIKRGPGGSDPPQEPHILLPLSPCVDGAKIYIILELCKQNSKKVSSEQQKNLEHPLKDVRGQNNILTIKAKKRLLEVIVNSAFRCERDRCAVAVI